MRSIIYLFVILFFFLGCFVHASNIDFKLYQTNFEIANDTLKIKKNQSNKLIISDSVNKKSSALIRYENYLKSKKEHNDKVELLKKNIIETRILNENILKNFKDNDKKVIVENDSIQNKKLPTRTKLSKSVAVKKDSLYVTKNNKLIDEKQIHKDLVAERRLLQLMRLAENRKKNARFLPNQDIKDNKSQKELVINGTSSSKNESVKEPEEQLSKIVKKSVNQVSVNSSKINNLSQTDDQLVVSSKLIKVKLTDAMENNKDSNLQSSISQIKTKSQLNDLDIANDRIPIEPNNIQEIVNIDKEELPIFAYEAEMDLAYISTDDLLIKIDILEKIKNKIETQQNYLIARTSSDLEDETLEMHKQPNSGPDMGELMVMLNMLETIEAMELKKMKIQDDLTFFKAREEFNKNPQAYNEKVIIANEKQNLSKEEMLRKINHLENTKTKIQNNHAYFLNRIVENIDSEIK